MYYSAKTIQKMLNWYPPYWGTGIKVIEISDNWERMQIRMKLRWYNRNLVGSHFGGSLYSMVDPPLMIMALHRLGKDYIVWDKSAEIEYIKAGRGEVTALVLLSDEAINEIKQKTENGEKYLPSFEILITDKDQQLVAKVKKTLYVRKKKNS